MIRKLLAALCLAAVAVPAPVSALIDFNGARFNAELAGRSVRYAQARQRRGAPAKANNNRAICRNNDKGRYRSRLSPAKARHLSSLCRRAGY